jgi:hypothetical protein
VTDQRLAPTAQAPEAGTRSGNPWSDLITAYRNGPHELFGPIIIRALQADIRTAAESLRPPAGALVTADDIQDELRNAREGAPLDDTVRRG